ncbi:HNH endonuclease signature motif containing protein [Georgenia thermotolerans]|uniref:DUF222 domain-containing protein n=1 Tax=Georgenia thermotolerans TaxID=527326 RepID=A0A7J5UQH2_9MICO|nr:HNH endonuclease signature motif containing protein [Georgenia thermotolerans]KAE8764460.1 DUF222 domain-containing protein [Georgenia thermotolerans]
MVDDDAFAEGGPGVPVPSVSVVEAEGRVGFRVSVPLDAWGTVAAEVALEMAKLEGSVPWFDQYAQAARASYADEPGRSVEELLDASRAGAGPGPHDCDVERYGVSRYGLTSPAASFLERQAPSPALARRLAGTALDRADDATIVETIAGWERLASWALSQQARAVMELANRRGSSTAGATSTAAEIAARLGLTQYAGEMKLNFAFGLDNFPEIADALTAGRIDRRKAEILMTLEPGLTMPEQRRVVADLLTPQPQAAPDPAATDGGTPAIEAGSGMDAVPDDAAAGADAAPDDAAAGADAGPTPDQHPGGADVSDTVSVKLPLVEDLTGTQLRAHLRAAAVTAGADAGRKRREKAFADRHVLVEPAGDAMAWVSALIRADDAEATRVCLDALAAAAKGPTGVDRRNIDQRRADVFTDVFTTILRRGVDLTGAELPTFHGNKPHIQVTIPAGTLLGLSDAPAELGGYGPIPAELAREIAADGTWRGLFTDATGCFNALGTTRYRPGADLSRQVIARDVTCTFPGCRQPAWKADLDHIASYDPAVAELLEQTTRIRLQALCRRHHNLKTTKFWSATRDETTGAIHWTAPSGHTYTRAPPTPVGAVNPAGPVPRDDPDDDPPPF